MASINAVLTRLGKNLAPGETITFTLVKGPSTVSSDPISTTDKRTPALSFPRMAKFIDTVVKPDFQQRFQNGRLYEENVPTAKDDSEDETSEHKEAYELMVKDDEGNIIPKSNPGKKKKRWRRYDPPRRHWVLCDEDEYQAKLRNPSKHFPKGSSHRYEGVPEYNTSNYILLNLENNNHNSQNLQLNVQTVHGFHSFSQPARIENVSLQQVEQKLSSQRALFKKQLLQSKRMLASQNDPTSATTDAAAHSKMSQMKLRKARLFQKLLKSSNSADDDHNDVMSDLSFKNRETSTVGIKARQELLSDMADEDVLVDGDGVLGGANDSEFGGGGRFGSFRGGGNRNKNAQQQAKKKASAAEVDKHSGSANLYGSIMADDFYTRDVSAEYEDLDYDPNEQFDDDDQDMGQGEISIIDQGGFVGDGSDNEEDEGDDDADSTGGGLATKAGYKAFMAKARGETVGDENLQNINAATGMPAMPSTIKKLDPSNPNTTSASEKESKKPPGPNIAPKPIVPDTTKPTIPDTTSASPPSKKQKQFHNKDSSSSGTGVALDASGQRIINIDTVRKEIWLHNQQISLKKLGKIFGVSSKSKDRVAAFKACIKELCNVIDDPVEGQKICRLKQHYSNMGSG